MARTTRKDEEYLESNEPIAVVLLNNIANIVEDVGETLVDFAKLQKQRPEEFMQVLSSIKENPQGILATLPEGVSAQIMSTFGVIFAKVQTMQQEMAGKPSASGSPKSGPDAGIKTPLGTVDPEKMNPEQLKVFGTLLKQEAAKIEKAIQQYEKTLLKEKK